MGPRDLQQGTCRVVRRLDGGKRDVELGRVAAVVRGELERIHLEMLRKATEERDASIETVWSWDEAGFLSSFKGSRVL